MATITTPIPPALHSRRSVDLSARSLQRAIADPVRWRLVSELAAGTRRVYELQPIAAVTVPVLARHLKVLREAGLVIATRRGRWIDYTLAPDALDRLRAALVANGQSSRWWTISQSSTKAGR